MGFRVEGHVGFRVRVLVIVYNVGIVVVQILSASWGRPQRNTRGICPLVKSFHPRSFSVNLLQP